jgi:hypothetical protein
MAEKSPCVAPCAEYPAALSERAKRMILDSDPDDITGEEGAGVELRSGADYAVARALQRRGLGHIQGPGGELSGMYWNNASGLQVRRELLE